MPTLSRIVLIRHGETVGESSIRFYGRTDVALSKLGCEQARVARRKIPGAGYELVVSSPLSRAWKTALLALPGCVVRLEADFREIDFGRWEGLTKEEIAELDPTLYEDWQRKRSSFDFPDGEPRADFRARVERGFERIRGSAVSSVIVVAHKGVVRTLVEALAGEVLDPPLPELGQVLYLSLGADGRYSVTDGS